ncbi:hypothetical protein EDD28_1685 [Salana multivorans]|uniref:Lipoprotein n=1 Tax=Salana multivorans TaxID=120377 RepID=A0A3N2DBK9_9MICO|nr:hypothetical protein [Salana multivorans]ROR97092.1 hypothetical protein EDD28_1685 [Salana multivorans]
MTQPRVAPRRVLRATTSLGAVALALTLSACSGGAAAPGGSGSTGEPAGSGDPGAAASDVSLADCLTGDWTMDLAAARLAALAAGDSTLIDIDLTGDAVVTVDATTWTNEVDLTSSVVVESKGGRVDVTSVTTGTYATRYTLDGDRLTQTDLVSADGTVTTTIDGRDRSGDFTAYAAQGVGAVWTVTCTGDSMTLAPVGQEELTTGGVFTRR